MKKKEKEFKVTDKRIFDEKGNLRKEFKKGKKSTSKAKKSVKEEKKAQTGKKAEEEKAASQQIPASKPDFISFVLSLTSSVFIYLGIIEDPISKEKKVDLPAAKQMIDIIEMLKEKTHGNLQPKEQNFIDNILYEIRIQYLNKSKAIKL